MNTTYLRGQLYYADLSKGVGSEQEGYRPVLIVQNNVGNKYSPTVIVAAVTSKVGVKPKLPTHYFIEANTVGLTAPSIVLLEQGHDVVIVDNLCNSKRVAVDRVEELSGKQVTFYQYDVCD